MTEEDIRRSFELMNEKEISAEVRETEDDECARGWDDDVCVFGYERIVDVGTKLLE